MEHLVPEQMFSTAENPAQGISAVKALAIASAEGQRIWTIDQNNLNTALAAINLDTDIENEIRSAVNSGKVATAHEAPVAFSGTTVTGYLLIDPATGAGAYKISGGANGGWMLIAAFLIIVAIILFSFFTRRVGAFISASVAFYSLANRIEQLAADDSLSPEEFVRRARIAMAIAITAAALPLSSSSTNAYGQASEVAFRIWVSGFLSIIGIQLFP